MSEETIYKEMILNHARSPKYRGLMADWRVRQVGQNPLCGDHIVIYLKEVANISGHSVKDSVDANADSKSVALEISHEGYGCAITVASASILAHTLHGASRQTAHEVCVSVLAALNKVDGNPHALTSPEIIALISVRDRPARIKCATLPWLALKTALSSLATGTESEPVTSEI